MLGSDANHDVCIHGLYSVVYDKKDSDKESLRD